jgi:hypothetical protein
MSGLEEWLRGKVPRVGPYHSNMSDRPTRIEAFTATLYESPWPKVSSFEAYQAFILNREAERASRGKISDRAA